MTNFTAEQTAAIEKVKKLMALAAGNANEHEAAAATERANFILAQMNLSMEELAASSGQDSSARSKDRLVGGFYQHERDMWKAIAELNFCWYNTVKVTYDDATAKKLKRRYAHHHQVIGRTVNILATQLMADYLLQTLERLTREYCELERPWEKWMPRSSTAVSFRKGAAERLIEKINDKRREVIMEERRKEREAQDAAKASGSTATAGALTVISNLVKSEYQANYDFKYGEGAYARQLAIQSKWEDDAKRLQAEHDAKMLSDPKYAKAYRKAQEKEANRSYRSRKAPEFKGDHSAFSAGYRNAANVGLDAQVSATKQERLK